MKILFIHLSDAHFRNKDFVQSSTTSKLVDSLSCVGEFDECLIVFSGDVAFSGQESDYRHAKAFLGLLISKLKIKYNFTKPIYTLIVPGNHDINFDKKSRNRDEISKLLKSNVSNMVINEELKKMKDFFDFANINHCFLDNELLDIRFIYFNNFKLRFNLINSAIFSVFKDDDDDNDKGLHFLRNIDINALENGESADLEITVLHHPLDWYNLKVENSIKEAVYKYSSILFVGHEHYVNKQGINNYRNGEMEIYNAGALLGDNNESIFSSIIFDTIDESTKLYGFNWDNNSKIYISKEDSVSKLQLRKRNNNGLKPNLTFTADFRKDFLNQKSDFLGYYVFPRLSMSKDNTYSEEHDINNQNDFLESIKNVKMCLIEGSDLSGKTTLLKKIYIELSKEKVPLFFDIKSLDKAKIKKVCQNVFREQYSEKDSDYCCYIRLNKDKRIALIDDADKCDRMSMREFLNEYKDFFGQIIVVNSTQLAFDFKEKLKEIVDNDKKEVLRFKISPFFTDKRKELMYSICKLSNSYMTDIEITKKVELLDSGIRNQLTMVPLNPNFIIMYTDFFENRGAITDDKKNVFNAVFQANITKTLQKQDKIKVDTIIFLLQKIAFYIHDSKFKGLKKYPLPYDDFKNIIYDYNTNFDKDIKSTELAKILIDSRIMKYASTGEQLIFVSNNYQSYFVAKELNEMIPSDEGYDFLKKIAENLCFGINAEILLFLCFLTGKTVILDHILIEADNLMNDWEESNFASKNIKFISNGNNEKIVMFPSDKDKEEKIKSDIEQEKMITENDEIHALSIYDYDESTINSFVSIQLKAIKFIEVISKALPNFEYRLRTDKKSKFVNAIYTYPNKLIKYLLNPLDSDFENTIAEAIDYFGENGKKISELEMKNYFINIATYFILNIFDFSVRIAVDENTIRVLDNYNYSNNINYQLMNLMMHENLGSTKTFLNKAEKLYDNNDDNFIKNIITRIVHKHYLSNQITYEENAQHFAVKFFGNQAEDILLKSRSNVLLQKSRN